MAAAYLVWGLLSSNKGWVVGATVYVVLWAVLALRRPTVIDQDGISRMGWRRPAVPISWAEVAGIQRTTAIDRFVTIELNDGTTVKLIDIVAPRAAEVAELSGLPLVAKPPPVSPRLPPQPPRRPTESEAEHELQRRTERLAADRDRLRAALIQRNR
jgi:hypothetical protein